MIYFIFPHDLVRGGVAFWGNQALTVGALLWLHCLHCSAVDMLKWGEGGTLKVWTVFGSAVVCCGEGWVNWGKVSVEKQNHQRMMRNKDHE